MRYPPHILEEIRARLPASDVVGRRVRLKKAGREWRGLSPFNAEKTPSFYVNDQKQFYHCFSSGKHGDVFTFLMETEGLSFPEAVERLAGEAGVTLPAPSADAREMETRRAGAFEVMEMAAAYYEEQLRGRLGAAARAYLDRRGLPPDIRARFRMGYATNERYGLRDHLAAKDVGKEAMAELGLLVTGGDIAVPFDKFRDRVMFPITDTRGRVIAFGGRAMQADAKAKYMNSPETPLFHKGRMLYNLHGARKAAHDRGTIIAVEGYVDVIAMTMAGHSNAVAGLGTALTEEQLALLWRHADEPILCFDGDGAGQRAAFKALDVALPALEPGKSLRFALLPEGQDPDDLLRSGGASAIDKVLERARPLVEVLWSRATEAAPADTPERKAGLAKSLREMVASIRDETVRRFYRDEIEGRLRALSPQGWGQQRRGASEPRGGGASPFQRRPRPGDPAPSPRITTKFNPLYARSTNSTNISDFRDRELFIIGLISKYPKMLDKMHDELMSLHFTSREGVDLSKKILSEFAFADAYISSKNILSDELLAEIKDLSGIKINNILDEISAEASIRQAINWQRRQVDLQQDLQEAVFDLSNIPSLENEEVVRHIHAALASLEGIEAEPGTAEEKERPMDAFLDEVLSRIGLTNGASG